MHRMNRLGVFLAFFASIVSIHAMAQAPQANTAAAAGLFRAGKFAEAQRIYAGIVRLYPKSYSATVRLGYIALLSNQLGDAQKWLELALSLKPADADVKIMLAETFYRLNDFPKAAAALSGLGPRDADKLSSYSTLNLAKLESFQGQKPYELQSPGETTRLKFLKAEPLPLVQVRVNGGP